MDHVPGLPQCLGASLSAGQAVPGPSDDPSGVAGLRADAESVLLSGHGDSPFLLPLVWHREGYLSMT